MCSICLPAACLDQLPWADTCTHLLQVMSHAHMAANCIIHAQRFTPEQAPQPLGMDKGRCGCCQTCGQRARQSVKGVRHILMTLVRPTAGHQAAVTCRWPGHPEELCVCVHSVDNSPLGAGQQPWASQQMWMQTPDLLPRPLLLWKLADKSELIPASASTTWEMDRTSPNIESSASCGVGKALLSPTLGFGRTGSPLDSQQLPGFLFILNLMCDW